jgi:hypothetical protein
VRDGHFLLHNFGPPPKVLTHILLTLYTYLDWGMTSNFSSKSISALVLLDSDLLSFAWCPQGACRGLTAKVGDQTSCQRFDRWPRLECSAIHVSDTWEVQYKYGVHQLTPGKCTSSVKPLGSGGWEKKMSEPSRRHGPPVATCGRRVLVCFPLTFPQWSLLPG